MNKSSVKKDGESACAWRYLSNMENHGLNCYQSTATVLLL